MRPASDERPPRVLVGQLGARRHYAVPLALHAHGMLDRLCTDLYAGAGAANAALRATARALPWPALRRWAGRVEPGLPPDRVVAFTGFGLRCRWRSMRARSQSERTRCWLWAGRRFCERIVGLGFGDATAAYVFTSAALEVLEACREQGKVGILDFSTAPRRYELRLLREEAERFPGWTAPLESDDLIDAYADRQGREAALADRIVCGSSYVRSALAAEGLPVGKAVVVPLGLHERFLAAPRAARADGPLRVLFVGGEGLRKGVGDLARAAALLRSGRIVVRVVGDLGLTAAALAELRRDVELAGSVPRSEVRSQYEWADVFVLPSISDTFGLTILEAMGAGLPALVTPHTAGADVIRDGEHGFVVPVRSPEAIAAKLDLLASDRERLRVMSAAARDRAAEFSIAKYAERLADCVKQAHSARNVA